MPTHANPDLLRGAAQSWWEFYLATHANPEAITWEEFRDNFRRYHVLEGLMIVRKEEFLALKQGPMSVSEYRDKFLHLSRYAPEDVNTDAKRQYRFLRGLVDPLHYQLMNHTFPTFQHLIDRAIMTERKRREMEDRKRKIGGPQVGSSSRPRYSGNPPQKFKQGNQHQHQHQRQNQQQQYQRQFPQQQQYRQSTQPGGNQYQRQSNQAARLPALATNQSNQAALAQGGSRACFHCGEQGHWANHCPKKAAQQQPAPNAPVRQNVMQQGSNNHGQPRAQYEKVNHLEADTVQETPGVALGTFSVEYHYANVLFDTGETHSFVTASWVESHNIPVAPMYPLMRVSSVGGRTQTDRFCPSAKIQIRGIEFPADLIVMGNQDTTIDVIPGMNWLTKYQASLSCDKRTVKLVSPSREEVLVQLILSGPRKGSYHKITARIEEIKPSEAISVVSDFPDVFPEELSGMPPERKVEFALELIPGIAPISKRAYRVSGPELVELKKQIDELLEKRLHQTEYLALGSPSAICGEEGWHKEDVH
jgi:hypothetical protein